MTKRTLSLLAGLAVAPLLLALPSSAVAQNLLLTNTSFESGTDFVNSSAQTSSVNIPGWTFTITSGSFVGVSDYGAATNLNGGRAAYLGGGSSFSTASASRASILAGRTYLSIGFARTDSDPGVISNGTLTLNFYSGNADASLLLGSFSVSAAQPAKTTSTDPFNQLSISGVAPVGATYAGLTYTTTSGAFQNIDNFQLNAVPEPATWIALVGGACLLCGVSWSRRARA